MKRHLQTRRTQISKELKKYESVRKVHRQARKKSYLPTIGLVGYTNAGKSSLTNMLTGKNVYVADKLFATLGTHVGKLYIPSYTGK
jgi:GTP-binding protein HflX